MENRTTFIIAHRIQSVMIADLILVLDKGEVIQMGTHEELVSQMDGMYRRIYDIQTRIDEELEIEISSVNLISVGARYTCPDHRCWVSCPYGE